MVLVLIPSVCLDFIPEVEDIQCDALIYYCYGLAAITDNNVIMKD